MSKKFLKCIVLVSLFLLVLSVAPLGALQARPGESNPSPQEAVDKAWEMAQQSGTYTFRAEHFQTTYPAPGVGSAGQVLQEDRVALIGDVDQAAERINMTFWQDASYNPNSGYEIKIEDGITYGRRGQGGWEELDNVTDAFAPNGDPLSFLAGVKDIVATGKDVRTFSESGIELSYERYTFTFDGPAFARYVRDEAQIQLQEQGQLPPGVQLDLPAIYMQTTGTGELWLDANGLPARLNLDLDLGRQDNGELVEATITTDYSGYNLERVERLGVTVEQNPRLWLANQLSPLTDAQVRSQISITLSFWLLGTAVFLFIIQYWRRREFYNVVVLFCIFTILANPLMQANQVYAYGQRQYQQQQAITARQAEAETQPVNTGSNWDPHRSPAEQQAEQQAKAVAAEQLTTDLSRKLVRPHKLTVVPFQQSGSSDTDGDGLTDDEELLLGTEIDNPDSDDDTLTDGVEVHELHTSPIMADSDSDLIPDNLEIRSFTMGGKDWYLNPNEADSNQDGILDGTECFIWASENPAQDPSASCSDVDGDNLPDVYDDDNDNDGVKDNNDSSPNDVSTVFDQGNPLTLHINNLTDEMPVIVNLQLRPTDIETLNYHGHILDWPSGDNSGFIQRNLDTTFATTSSQFRSEGAEAANGDIRVLPMIEVTIPWSEGHYGNLPVLDGAPIVRTETMTVGQWLDTTELDQYGIMVVDKGENSSDLLAYAPVIPFSSGGGDLPSGFGANMFYWPSQDTDGIVDWGSSHEYRLVWLVQMLTDECPDGRVTCPIAERQDKMTVIHSYYEGWRATGLRITEELGTDTAIIYENPAQDSDLNADDSLWPLTWQLTNTFVEGRDCDTYDIVTNSCVGDGNPDVTMSNLATEIDAFQGGNGYLVVNQPTTYPHRNYLAQAAAADARDVLNNVFFNYRNQTVPTLLFAYEINNRAVEMNQVDFNAMAATVDFANSDRMTMAGINWGSYRYVGGDTPWEAYNLADYLVYLAAKLESNDLNFRPADSSLEEVEAAEGKLLWAQLYYASLYHGISNMTRLNSALTWIEEPEDRPEIATPEEPGFSIGGASDVSIVFVNAIVYGVLASVYTRTGTNFWKSFKHGWSRSADGQYSLDFDGWTSKSSKVSGNLIVGVMVAAIAVAGTIYGIGLLLEDNNAIKVGEQISNAVSIAGDVIELTILLLKVVKHASNASALISSMGSLSSNIVTVVVVAIILIIVVWVMYFAEYGHKLNSIEARIAAKYSAGATVVIGILAFVTIIAFILIALGPVGLAIGIIILVLLALLSIYEALGTFFGWPSVSGMLAEAIAESLYEINEYIDISDSDRLDFNIGGALLNDRGFTDANGYHFDITIFNKIRGTRSENRVRQAAFAYELIGTEEISEDSALHHVRHGDNANDWVWLANEPDVTLQLTTSVSHTVQFVDVGTGINRNLSGHLYLQEAFEIPYEFCDTMFEVVNVDCDDEYYGDVNAIDLGATQLFDILPNRLSNFVSLRWNHNGSLSFPRQRDIDGDGLLSTAQGGVDTDDRNPDRDGDGLTDSYEVQYGLNPDEADSDFDGLTDSQELLYHTDPMNGDMDYDGLSDYVELVQGWLIAYDDGQVTRVWSDPYSADADGDSLNDQQELIFGLHPDIADDPDSIHDTVQFGNFDVSETTAPELLLQFEEDANTTVFSDGSGNGYTAVCDQTNLQCPQTQQDGRYGYGLEFDGSNDALTVEGIELANRSFTIAAWVGFDTNLTTIASQDTSTSPYSTLSFSKNSAGDLSCSFGTNDVGLTADLIGGGLINHVACVYDIDSNTRTLYINGTAESSDNPGQSYNGSGLLHIGKYARSSTLNMDGLMDEVAIYYQALDGIAIEALMNGRYNISDGVLAPGDALTYQTIVTNTNDINPVVGLLSGQSSHIDPAIPDAALLFNFNAPIVDSQVGNIADGVTMARGSGVTSSSSVDTAHGNAGSFDDTATLVISSSVPLANRSFTLAAWAKRNNSTNYDYILWQGVPSQNQGLHFGFRPNSQFTCAFYGNALNVDASYSDNEWHHWVCTYDATTNDRIIYRDGIVVASNTASADYQGRGDIYIGSGINQNYFNGLLDDVAIIPEVVSQDAVQSLMSSSASFIATDNEVELFAVAPEDATTVTGSAHVNEGAATSVQQFNTYAEAIIDTGIISVPATDANAGSLVTYVPFEDMPGTTIIDNHVSATEFNCNSTCPFVGVAGRFHQGAYFDGINDKLIQSTNTFSEISFAAWVKPESGTILDLTTTSAPSKYGLFITTDEIKYYYGAYDEEISFSVPADVWSHLVVTVDVEPASQGYYEALIRVYINGSLFDEVTSQATSLGHFHGSGIRIGAEKSDANPLRGYLDEVRVYDVALSEADALELYQSQGTPVLDFRFDEEAGAQSFNDASGNNLVGTPQALGCVVLDIPEIGRHALFGDELNDNARVIINDQVVHSLNYWYVPVGGAYSTGSTVWKKLYYSTVLCEPATLELEFWDAASQTATTYHTTTLDPASALFDGSLFTEGNCNNICVQVSGERFDEASPTAGTDGRIGNTALFATDGALEVSDQDGRLSDLQSFTMMAWLYPEKSGGYIIVGHKRGANNQDGFVWRVTSDGRLEVKGGWPITIDEGVAPNLWSHVIVVRDLENQKMRWYVNGQLVHQGNILNPGTFAEADGDPLLIGGGDGSEYFRGQLDELVIYDYAMSEGMVQSIYAREARTFAASANVNLLIDNDTPTVELLSDYNYRPGGYNQLVVATADPTSEIRLLDTLITDVAAQTSEWQGAIPCQNNAFGVEAWCPAFMLNNEGAYQFSFRTVDAVGNETTSGAYNILVDTTAPLISGSYNDTWISADQDGKLKWRIPLMGTVTDPDLVSGDAGSGVYTDTVTVNLVDATGTVVSETVQSATVDGSTWSIDYVIDGTRPQGRYTIWVSAEDNVGNVAETAVGTLLIDERAAHASLNPTALPEQITGDVTITGIASEQVFWGSEDALFHFEEAAGSTTFSDYSRNGRDATCTNCPTTTAGLFGQALDFNGTDTYLLFPQVVDPGNESFTASAWFRASALGGARIIIAQQSNAGAGRSWLYVNGAGQLVTYLGGTVRASSSAVAAGEWHHAALTYDGSEVRLYLDGKLEMSDTFTPEPSLGEMVIGSNKDLVTQHFNGSIDEVAIYDQALTAEQIYALAQSVAHGANQVELAIYPAAPYWGANVLQLHFDEENGATTFADSSGRNLDAICTNCPTATWAGYNGNALDFDGIDDAVTITNTTEPLDHIVTVAAWINHHNSSNENNIVSQKDGDGNAPGWQLRLNNDNTATFVVADGNSSWSVSSSTAIPAEEWQHMVGLMNAATGEVQLYVNGVLANTQTGFTGNAAATTALALGHKAGSNPDFFDGLIDEVVIYDRALSMEEIKGLAQTPDWQTATLGQPGALLSDWSYTISGVREGFYQLRLRGSDDDGNTETGGVAWRGVIDTVAPRIELTATHIGSDANAETQYEFTITDFAIDETTLTYDRCSSSDLVTLAYEEPHRLLDGIPYQITASCTVAGHESGTVTVSVCDGVGACTTENVTLSLPSLPISHWSFTEGSGTTTADASGNGHDGTLNGGVVWTNETPTGTGYALYFDGVDDSVSIADSDDIDFATDQDFTVSVWVKPDAFQPDNDRPDNEIVEKWSGGGVGYPFVIRYMNQASADPGKVRVARYDGNNIPSITSNVAIDDGQYHHILFSKQGDTLYLYIDGVLDNTTVDTTTGSTTNDSALFLGKRGNNMNYFKGYVDDLQIFDHALSTNEIQALYNASGSPLSGTAVGNFTPASIAIVTVILVLLLAGFVMFRQSQRRKRYQQ